MDRALSLVALSNAAAFERVRDGIITNVRLAVENRHDAKHRMFVRVNRADHLALVSKLDEFGLTCEWSPISNGRGGTLYVR